MERKGENWLCSQVAHFGEGVRGKGMSECTVQQTWLSAGFDAYLAGTGTLMS